MYRSSAKASQEQVVVVLVLFQLFHFADEEAKLVVIIDGSSVRVRVLLSVFITFPVSFLLVRIALSRSR